MISRRRDQVEVQPSPARRLPRNTPQTPRKKSAATTIAAIQPPLFAHARSVGGECQKATDAKWIV